MKWAAIFDWDGVIVDSSDYHEESWERLAEEEDRPLPPNHFKQGFGMRNETIIPEVLGWTERPAEIERLDRRKGEIYRELVAEKGLSPLPGVESFLAQLHGAEVPCAVASSTERQNITFALEQMGMKHEFGSVVAGEDVENGKPDPEVFLTAADDLGVSPEKSVVFEDAHVGIKAARSADMKVIAVDTTHPAEELEEADLVVSRLDTLDPNHITTLLLE
ncbi:MAG: HAD family hydrolase [Candidatus Brocadiia bacterium]